jgi:hypothetical protein
MKIASALRMKIEGSQIASIALMSSFIVGSISSSFEFSHLPSE